MNVGRPEVLLKTGALQHAILNSPVFSIIATDEKGIIQLFNVGAERMLGYTADEVVDRLDPSDLQDPQEVVARAHALSEELATPIAPGFEALAWKASRGIEDSYGLTFVRKDGGRFPAVISITALRDDREQIIGYLLIGADNSVRKLAEEQLNQAKAAAEEANRAKSDFLSHMSHELRSPLNAILGFAQLMESDLLPQTGVQKEGTAQILKAGWYLLDLINEILDLALIESGKLLISLEPMSLDDVLLECRAMVEPQAQKAGISMSYYELGEPVFVHADRTRVKQILLNLLTNAIKYNRTGGAVIVDCSAISPERVRVSVIDTGLGLSPDQLEQLFQPFNRLGQEDGGKQGTGIGLVMTKRLVDLMGGVIVVESTVGKGSRFSVELLRDREPSLPADTSPSNISAPSSSTSDVPMRTVLCVEDNPANLKLVEQLLARRRDVRMLSAGDGTLGVRLAREHHPAVILMDINLPGISGLEALRILQADPRTRRIPVVAVSSNAMPHDIRRGIEAGFFRYLTKPLEVRSFMDTLDLALQHSCATIAATGREETSS